MRIYVEDPARSSVQGIWLFRPARGVGPDYCCRQSIEGLAIRDLDSARRFFREKVRWGRAAV